ncbi:hypothetical protein DRH13_04365 [Candidatus Woesebacteria bacterium]|nr:MAG: hypothetical protein DRH13_04365 [Candidatus Woesebacteria bacterium]
MKVYFIKTKHGLSPRFDSDQESLDLINNGTVFMKGFKLLRKPEFHRLVFRFLNTVFKFQDQFDDFEKFRERVKWYSGSYSTQMIDEHVITTLDSWSFESMDDMEFKALFKRIKTACWEKFMPSDRGAANLLSDQLLEYD